MNDKIYGIPVGSGLPQSDWNITDQTKNGYIKNKPENLVHIDSTDNEIITDVDNNNAVLYTAQTLTNAQKNQVCRNIGIPTVTVADAGKFMRVSSTGEWTIESIMSAEEVSF